MDEEDLSRRPDNAAMPGDDLPGTAPAREPRPAPAVFDQAAHRSAHSQDSLADPHRAGITYSQHDHDRPATSPGRDPLGGWSLGISMLLSSRLSDRGWC